jgi:translation initiation factor IF-2
VLDSVTAQVIALLPPTIETRVTGEATVLQLFDIDVKGKSKLRVAGCRVGNGVVEKERLARVLRKGEVVHSGEACFSHSLSRSGVFNYSVWTHCPRLF